MKTLFLDLASSSATLACVTEDAVVALREPEERLSDADLIPAVEELLAEASWTYDDLTHVACAVGPGGFTSLRIVVTHANTLADQLQIPSAGVHLSGLYRARSVNDDALWLHSTKKDQLFVRGGEWAEPTLISIDDMQNTKYQIPNSNWMGELIPEHREVMGCDSEGLQPLQEVLPAFVSQLSYDTELLIPWYGRGW